MSVTSTNPWAHALAAWVDPEPDGEVDAFARLHYEPNCLPRLRAREEGRVAPACGRCPQELFHTATEDDVLYGGAAGGGKTKALLMEGIRACVRYPGMWVGAYRRTYDELAESLLKELAKLDFCEALGAKWNKTEKELSFPSRRGRQSKMRFRYAESIDDATRRQGGDYQLLLVDERTLMAPGVVAVLAERLRSSDPTIPVLGVRSSANPGGASHAEVKAAYIDATDHGHRVLTDESGRTIRFIPAKLSDNPYLDRDASYHRTLDAIPDPARRKAMKEGNWDVFAGQFFPEWDHNRHVIDPVTLPLEWEREAGIDYGYAAPWAVLWAAFDNDGRAWVYRELYEVGIGQTDQARMILAGDGDKVRARHADPSMWAKTGEANSNADVYAEQGCRLVKAVNDRLSGWARVHHYLSEMPACDMHRSLGWSTCPRLHVFSTATNLIRTLPAVPRDKKKPEDLDTASEDHALDALRYLLMGHGPPHEMTLDTTTAGMVLPSIMGGR